MSAPLILRILTLLAVLLMPLGMIGGGPAMATPHHGTAATGHCADMDEQQNKDVPGRKADCTIACAAILPVIGDLGPQALALAAAAPLAPPPATRGLSPEAATPPPRPA